MKLTFVVICFLTLLSICLCRSYSYSKQNLQQPRLNLVQGNRETIYSKVSESNGEIVNDSGFEFAQRGEMPIPRALINQILHHYYKYLRLV